MKDKWIEIDVTLDSLDGIRRAKAPEGFEDRLLQRMTTKSRVTPTFTLSKRTIWQIAAGFALLIALNMFTWLAYPSTTQTQTAVKVENPIGQEFFGYTKNLNF